jgi:hypothetical protein
VGSVRSVETKHPALVHFVLAIAVGGFCMVTLRVCEDLGLSRGASLAIVFGVLFVAAMGLVVLFSSRKLKSEDDFERTPLTLSTELSPGAVARVRVTLQEPATLVAPIRGSRCVYYRAAALVPSTDPYEPVPDEIAACCEGELAVGTDASGPILLDLRSGVDLFGSNPLPGVLYEQPRAGDPIGVGVSDEYQVDLRYLEPGDEIEAVGIVEVDGSGRPKIGPDGKQLRVRFLASRASSR